MDGHRDARTVPPLLCCESRVCRYTPMERRVMAWLRRSPRLEQCRLGCSVRLVLCVCADGCCMRVASGCVCKCVCVWNVLS